MICSGYPGGCHYTVRRIIVTNNVLTLNYNSLKFSQINNAQTDFNIGYMIKTISKFLDSHQAKLNVNLNSNPYKIRLSR